VKAKAKAEMVEWVESTLAVQNDAEVTVPPNLIRALLMQSVIDNWPRYEAEHDLDGNPVALKFGSPAAANKALEMLAKDAGMMADQLNVTGGIEIRINGVDVADLR